MGKIYDEACIYINGFLTEDAAEEFFMEVKKDFENRSSWEYKVKVYQECWGRNREGHQSFCP